MLKPPFGRINRAHPLGAGTVLALAFTEGMGTPRYLPVVHRAGSATTFPPLAPTRVGAPDWTANAQGLVYFDAGFTVHLPTGALSRAGSKPWPTFTFAVKL